MSGRSVVRFIVAGALSLVAFLLTFTISSSSAPQDKPVELVSKNIQVLNGMPESQLLPVMHLMRTALGVRCDHCHIAENGKYWMDEKPAKETARRMIRMVFEINKANFGGQPVVTCNTCHRGSTKPVGIPAIGQAAFENTTNTPPSALVAQLVPTVESIFQGYAKAAGGKSTLEGIQTRVTEGFLIRPKLVNPSGKLSTLEIFQKAPNRLLVVITSPEGGVTYQGYNGKVGWIKTPTLQREMTNAELAQFKQQADFYKELNFKDEFSTVKLNGLRKVGEREAYVVEGVNSSGKTEQLLFDTQTFLLVQRVLLNPTILGLDPVQTDFLDYRDVNGVKLPFTIQTSYLDNNHYGTTRKFSQIKQNVPVDDAKFEPPPK